ncbi:MAG: aminodeoxychorismate synthase component I [Planctomycetota bacterium]|nr:aminodeoxychorismate synthase component I [Planctomycetota bacterium]
MMKTTEDTGSAVVAELPSDLDPFSALGSLSDLPFPVLLDSSLRHPELGGVSYLVADPFSWSLIDRAEPAHLRQVDEVLRRHELPSLPHLPPFQGGIINLCSYDLKTCFESIPDSINEFAVPQLFWGAYDVVFIFDHLEGRNWLVSQGLPETEPVARRERAENRLAWFQSRIKDPRPGTPAANSQKLDAAKISALHPSGIANSIFSNFSRSQYIQAVQKCIDYIEAGDIFQVNLAQRLLSRQQEDALSIYDRLRRKNQATFAAFLDLGKHQILSSSPERLLSVDGDWTVETRPIKGTRQRSCYPEANLFSAEGLITSEKDRAENVMIVDLLRNDLSKICLDESIQVSKLCGIEPYEYVQHLVSVIRGQLPGRPRFESLFKALFPGGSITGAPKVRAMEIIAEIEKVARGAYCGSLGYFGFNGTVDQNILIRTMTLGQGWVQIPVGGGIVSQSDPVSEYEETVHKAHGMLRAIV